LLAGSSSLLAQDATNTPPAGEHSMKGRQNLAKELNLTDDQKPKVLEIMKNTREQLKAVRADASLTPEDKKAKAKAIQEDTTAQLKAVLTPDQFTKWQELSKRGHRPPAGSPPPAN
jgi:Spy/CpxP family protein refolding chaperone